MPDYHLRPATLLDQDALVHQRIAMFVDMGVAVDRAALDAAYRPWLIDMMRRETYKAWVMQTTTGEIVAGGGMTIIPWPPGPRYPGDRLAFVYNVFTEPAHRGHGLGRAIMEAIHAWCRAQGITSIALNASPAGQPLYESIGYAATPNPMMFFAFE